MGNTWIQWSAESLPEIMNEELDNVVYNTPIFTLSNDAWR